MSPYRTLVRTIVQTTALIGLSQAVYSPLLADKKQPTKSELGETLVLLFDGTYNTVGKIEVGDTIWNPRHSQPSRVGSISKVDFKRSSLRTIQFQGGQITAEPKQSFFTARGMVFAANLNLDDELLAYNYEFLPIVKIVKLTGNKKIAYTRISIESDLPYDQRVMVANDLIIPDKSLQDLFIVIGKGGSYSKKILEKPIQLLPQSFSIFSKSKEVEKFMKPMLQSH